MNTNLSNISKGWNCHL